MAHLHRLIFVALLAFLSWLPASSHATIAKVYQVDEATVQTRITFYDGQCGYPNNCTRTRDEVNPGVSFQNCAPPSGSIPYTCLQWRGKNAPIYSLLFTATVAYTLQCPVNSTNQAGICVCNTGFVDSGNACVPSTAAAQTVLDQLNASGDQFCTTQHQVTSTSFCYGGFTIRASVLATAPKLNTDGSQVQCLQGPFTSSGFQCGPNSTDVTSNGTCKAGKVPGTVNGVTVCVTPGSATVSGSSSAAPTPAGSASSPTSGLGADAPPTATTSSQSTTCTNGNCTTTTTYKDSGGAVVGTRTDERSQSSFCDDNPSSPICIKSSYAGSCSSPPVCTGDAVQCAIAAQTLATQCALSPSPNAESQLYDDSKGVTGDRSADLPGNRTVQITSGMFDSSNALGVAASGLSDLNVTVWGRPYTLQLSAVNPWLSNLGSVLMAVTFLLCIRIVARG